MTKEELLGRLKTLCDEEEHAVPLYSKHLESTLFLAGFKPEVKKEIEDMLLTLSLESEVHARMFEAMIKKVKEAGRDVY